MNIEQLVDEIVAQRPVRKIKKPFRRMKRAGYRRFGAFSVRPLSIIEICELRAHVERCIDRACKAGHYCWRPNCPRCRPA